MIELIVAFIEWLAIAVMSTVGIDYTPEPPCLATEPTEYREVISWQSAVQDNALQDLTALTDCDNIASLRVIKETPTLTGTVIRYDS